MTTMIQKEWNNTYFPMHEVLEQTEHYALLHDPKAGKFTADSDYLVILKDRNTIESRSGAYVIAAIHMRDAEHTFQGLVASLEKVEAFLESDSRLN